MMKIGIMLTIGPVAVTPSRPSNQPHWNTATMTPKVVPIVNRNRAWP